MRFCTLFIIVFEEYLVKHAQICKKKKNGQICGPFLERLGNFSGAKAVQILKSEPV